MYKFGESGNLRGRPKGSISEENRNVRKFIHTLFDDNKETLKEDFKRLSPKERWKVVIGLLGYVTPKLNTVATFNDEEAANAFTVIWNEEKTYVNGDDGAQ